MSETNVIVEGRSLSKEFNGNVVLRDVSIRCEAGKAIALVGENGAGKSTLMNILTGSLTPTSGTVLVDGKEVHFTSPHQSKAMGLAFVHQELSLMEEMTVGENIMLGREPRHFGLIDSKALHRQAEEILRDIGYEIDVHAIVSDIAPSDKQITEIAKAWAGKPRMMIFDEPTSSLNQAESVKLFRFIDRIKKNGVAVIMISHRMDDIFETCDTAFVLKDGEFVFSKPVLETNDDELISKMVGREFKNAFPPRNEKRSDEIRVRLKDVCVGDVVRNVNMEVPAGSIIGVGGLEGQGQRELSRALFGIDPFTSGTYEIEGQPVKINSPRAAVANGIAFVPDDRKAEGLVLPLSVEENILSLILDRVSPHGFMNRKMADEEVKQGIEQLNIKVASPMQAVQYLSGGNQQKIVFSKWIKTHPKILYLHEPTRGVDVQSKLEIYALIRRLTAEGVSVVVFTSDILELIGLSDEIYVMYEGEISGHIAGAEATEEKIMQMSAKSANKRKQEGQ